MSPIVEAVVSVVLSIRFLTGYGQSAGRAVYPGTIHAVSVDNNAGFALYSDSPIGFAAAARIIVPVMIALVIGDSDSR